LPEKRELINKFEFLKKFEYFNLESSFEEVLDYVKRYKVFSFDFETAGLNELEPITVSFCVKSNDNKYYGFVVDFRDFYSSGQEYKEKIKIFFKIFDEAHLIIAHNISFDLKVLLGLGYDIQFLRYKIYDTMLAIYVNNTESEKSLKDITKTYFGNNIKYQEVDFISVLKSRQLKEIGDLSIKFKSYNLQDSLLAMMLYEKTYRLVERNNTILALFLETQIAFLGIDMFERGIYIDVDLLRKLKKEYERQVLELEDELKNIARIKYNYDLDLRSSISIKEFFKKHLIQDIKNIPKDLLTPKGDISLSIENLDFLGIKDKEFQEKYILYKETRKILESYGGDNLLINTADGRVVPNINTAGTKTMRMTITDPPLQTIPANAVGKNIRKCFRGVGNNKLLVADLSQLELRILAYYIDREELIEKV
jgi:DNA polymerase I-like protein with 3'-5' exonuclease and polymerase domains